VLGLRGDRLAEGVEAVAAAPRHGNRFLNNELQNDHTNADPMRRRSAMNPSDITNPALKKLTLKKETLRRLTAPELELAVGGARPTHTCTDPRPTMCGQC
jgi:hypothetical protein